MTKILFKLARPAKKAGGDRYESVLLTAERPNFAVGESKPLVIYVPQSISRTLGGGVVASEIEVTFDPK